MIERLNKCRGMREPFSLPLEIAPITRIFGPVLNCLIRKVNIYSYPGDEIYQLKYETRKKETTAAYFS